MAGFEFTKYKWGNPVFGAGGGQVTWSFATGSGSFFAFDAAISSPALQTLVHQAFAAWERVINIDFQEVPDSTSSDIRLGLDAIDGVLNVVGQTQYTFRRSSTEFQEIRNAEIGFDTSESWSASAQGEPGRVNFYATALHEIGHAIGLDHTDDPNTIMYAYLSGQTDLTSWDITGAQLLYGARPQATIQSVFNGTEGADFYVGKPLNETIYGYGGNDLLAGDGGDDTIDGGAGLDHVAYDLARSLYQVQQDAGGAIIVSTQSASSAEGTDRLLDVERLNFADGFLAFDLEGNAGQTYRLYQAAFDRTPDTGGLGFWIRELDRGAGDLVWMAQGFLNADEFGDTYGDPINISNADYLGLLYNNILGRAPEASGFNYWMEQLGNGMSRAHVLASFSESAENSANVAASIDNGIWYT
jgi:hypothetical protein